MLPLGLGHDTAKGGCPPGHISDCRYIVMMHPRKRDNNPDLDQEVTIASTGTHRVTTTTQEDPEWFKLLNTHQDEQQTGTTTPPKPTINSLTVGELVWYSTTMSPTTADQIQQQQHKHHWCHLATHGWGVAWWRADGRPGGRAVQPPAQ